MSTHPFQGRKEEENGRVKGQERGREGREEECEETWGNK